MTISYSDVFELCFYDTKKTRGECLSHLRYHIYVYDGGRECHE